MRRTNWQQIQKEKEQQIKETFEKHKKAKGLEW